MDQSFEISRDLFCDPAYGQILQVFLYAWKDNVVRILGYNILCLPIRSILLIILFKSL